jgi:ubiquinone/menaquinone biosynthesis C-methylase UbiE
VLTVEIARLGLGNGSRVLDLGCGDGRHSRWLRRLSGVHLVALDLGAEETLRTAASLAEMASTAFAAGGAAEDAGASLVVRGSGYDLPFADGSFDCVIVSEVLEHLDDDDAVLTEISRILKPGGILAVSVPREGPEAICWALSRDYRNSPGGHVRIYRRSQLRRKLRAHGYRIFAGHFAHALHSPYWWLKCLVGIRREDLLPVRLYHQLLVWDLMRQPWITRAAERLLNPWIGKSVVFYATKG